MIYLVVIHSNQACKKAIATTESKLTSRNPILSCYGVQRFYMWLLTAIMSNDVLQQRLNCNATAFARNKFINFTLFVHEMKLSTCSSSPKI